eukprot:2344100-Amphidinium_carterae.1
MSKLGVAEAERKREGKANAELRTQVYYFNNGRAKRSRASSSQTFEVRLTERVQCEKGQLRDGLAHARLQHVQEPGERGEQGKKSGRECSEGHAK